ncbi:MAG: cytochrome c [Gammaproteobacteria bacterium]|jgi:mono/diheme cytochrome c family protein|nr:cytochrome c [Gammaproteobacteria bacterium]
MKLAKQILPGLWLILLAGTASADELLAGNPESGQQLHAQYCTSCHTQQFGGDGSGMYSRPDRRVNSIEALMGQVAFCVKNTAPQLTSAQVDDLVSYLNQQHYHLEVAK